jgi:uncharacterized repeat protein (TIGR03803 family)
MPVSFVASFALRLTKRTARAAAVGLGALTVFAVPAAAHGFKTLHVFCENPLCPDGATPSALTADAAGNLFGTTRNAGPRGGGTVFELRRRAGGGYKFETLYSFCSQENCTDGELPMGRPVIDVSGNLYGTALAGGQSGYNGDVWQLKRKRGAWTLKVLHDFCVDDCTDGAEPMAGLSYAAAATGALYDGKSPLYGVAPFGGNGSSQGTVFQLTPGKHGWNFQVLYSFCPNGNCAGGAVPSGPLLPDASDNLYGLTYGGGSNSKGAVYEVSPAGGGWTETPLYSFCPQDNCADGEQPYGSLALDSSGTLFGTASAGGGTGSKNNVGCGALFSLAPNGGQWQQTMLHTFCTQADCADGATPMDAPTVTANGDLVGTAQFGGDASSNGVVWRLSGGVFETLHKFCRRTDCPDGAQPAATLIPDGSGHLIGTTSLGGPNFGGAIYEIAP